MTVNSCTSCQISISNEQMKHFKDLRIWVTKEKRIGTCEIKNRIEQGRKVIGYLNLIWGRGTFR
jgi:hypothetical protein